MKITKVCCQGCGADLQVDETVRYVTCNYCHARLEVVHDASTTHTRLMEDIKQNTERMAGNLRVIELQNDLERLDREWDQRRDSFMVTGKNGHKSLPTEAGSIIGGAFGIIVGVIMTGAIAASPAPGPFALVPLLFIGFAIYSIVSGTSKASAYRSANLQFEQRRASLIRGIEEARRQR